jgi:pimeloyl-ACP methyl ester carboxylesterase
VNDPARHRAGRVYFGWQFDSKGAKKLPGYAVRYYVNALAFGPEALHASFAIYRALDATIAQNQQRKERRLPLPVLGIGGAYSLGEQVADTMKLAADNVQTLVIPGCAHWVAEEALAALTTFLAPYRNGRAAARNPQRA